MEINIEEIRRLREEVENVRLSVARLNGRLDIIEGLVKTTPLVMRFRADDPNMENLGYISPYKCAHQISHIITARATEHLSRAWLASDCDCQIENE